MSWFIDNASVITVLLALVAVGLAVAWWVTKRVQYLGFAAGVLVLIGLVWLLTTFIISDSKQIELNVLAMKDALLQRKVDALFQHIAKDFNYKGMTREELKDKAQLAIANHEVREVRITAFKIEKLSRAKREATASFRVSAWGKHSENPYLFGTEADFILEGADWKLKTLRFYNPVVNQNQEFDLPGIR